MKWALAEEYDVTLAEDRGSALKAFQKKRPDIVTLDLGLPPRPASVEEGFAALSEILTVDPHAKIIVITGRGEKEHALKAVAGGAYDFLSKPVEIDELKVMLKRASYLAGLEREHDELMKRQPGGLSGHHRLKSSDAGSFCYGAESSDVGYPGADHRGERHGQGVGRQGDP